MPNYPILSFNTGEVTPQIDARSDVAKYISSCRTMVNMLPLVYGGATRRPGTRYIATAKNSPEGIRLVPFIYSAEIAYMCEFGNQYIRFYYDGAALMDGLVQSECYSPYLVADLQEVQFQQIGDILWCVHKDYPPYKLTRDTATTFSMTQIDFQKGPFITRNDLLNDDDVTMTSSATVAWTTGTLTASSAYFLDGHVNSLFSLTHPIVDKVTSISAAAAPSYSTAIDVKGAWSFTTQGTWVATVEIQRNVDSAGWETYRTYVRNASNVTLSDTEDEDNVQYRIGVTAYTSGTVEASLTVDSSTVDGIVKISAIVSSTVADIVVISKVASTNATKRWAEGAWNGVRGYPRAVCCYEDRIIYGGSVYEPQTVWLSETDDYDNFEAGVNDADSFAITITTTNDIRWLESIDGLLVGTSGDEWEINSSKLYTPLTPTNFTAKRHSTSGSKTIQAVRVNEAILFVDYVGRKVRELAYREEAQKYVAPDLNALAEHITEGGINAIAYQRNPDSILWCIRNDGTLLSLTYERDQNVVAWARHLVGLMQADSTSTSYYANAVSNYRKAYFAEDGSIWGVPFTANAQDVSRLSGDARDVGAGLVGITCTGHPFDEGDVVRFEGTSNYDGTHTLTSGTTSSELQFSDTYTAETFDGTETVVQYIGSLTAGVGRMVQDSSGNMYYGYNEGVAKITDGRTVDTTFFNPVGGWDSGMTVIGLAVTSDDAFLYVHDDKTKLYKFDLSDGSQIWKVDVGSSYGYDIAIDGNDNVYIPNIDSGDDVAKFDASDGAKTNFSESASTYAICVDDNMVFGSHTGVVIAGDYQYDFSPTGLYNLSIRTFDDTDGAKIALGGIYKDGSLYRTYSITTGKIRTVGQYIYVLNGDGQLYKLDSDLNIVANITAPTYRAGLFVDIWDRLVIVNQDWSTGQSEIFHYYDTDLNSLGSIDGFYTSMLKTWDAAVGGAYIGDSVVYYPGIVPRYSTTTTTLEASGTVESVAVIPGETEDEVWLSVLRTINGQSVRYIEQMQPRSWATEEDMWFVDCGAIYDGDATDTISGLGHLEGEEVYILADGAVHPPQTVSSGAITLDYSASKVVVGLPYRYTLKPMRFDITSDTGTTKGSIKKFSEVVISFLETLNAEYGKDTSNLFSFPWRTTEDYGTEPNLYTGDKIAQHDGGYSVEDDFVISGIDPMPCTIRAIIPRVKVTGR